MSLFSCKKQAIYTTEELNGKVFETKQLLTVERIKFSESHHFYMMNTGVKYMPAFNGTYSLHYDDKTGKQTILVSNNSNEFTLVFEIQNKTTIQLIEASREYYLTNKTRPDSAIFFHEKRKYKLIE